MSTVTAKVTAKITYLLSEKGRRDSLRKGGDGRHIQTDVGLVGDPDLDAFSVNDDGEVSFDLTELHGCDEDFNPDINPPASKGQVVEGKIRWDVVPTWEDLLAVVRGFKSEMDDMAAAREKYLARLARVGAEFMADPSARATRVGKGFVEIGGERFAEYDQQQHVIEVALKRANSDLEEAKKKNRATLADWVGQHGTENQRQRLAAGLLPWTEAFEAAETFLFAPLDRVPLYTRFEVDDICVCPSRYGDYGSPCTPKFQSVDATELTAKEWEQFAKIKATVPGATFQLREHSAQCKSQLKPEMKRGVIVKFAMQSLTFKREFALTIDEVPF